MTTTTAAERAADIERGKWILDELREHFRDDGLLLVSANYGTGITDYFKVTTIQSNPIMKSGQSVWHLTWAMSKVFGYSLRVQRDYGYWELAIKGGGYSKPDELARSLAGYYGLERVRYELI